jgi:AraC-like DNA-binding protein
MYIEFTPTRDFGFAEVYAKKKGLEFDGHVWHLPVILGKGFMKRINIDNELCIIVHSYQYLREPITFQRKASNINDGSITFRFISYQESDKTYLSYVQVLNDTIDVQDSYSANTFICNIIVKVKLSRLFSIMGIDSQSKVFSAFTDNLNKPFIYQENIPLEMREVIRELSEERQHEELEKLYYQTKVMELFYHFFLRFSRRTSYDFKNINKYDIEKILTLKEKILQDLKTPPKLRELAHSVGMCETKMKQLFKEIHGDSIYNYYLSARLNEAAFILKNDKSKTVAEVGHDLGFSNLSHFANLFKRYIGMNPKEYAMRITY